jgi:hypothetical protein
MTRNPYLHLDPTKNHLMKYYIAIALATITSAVCAQEVEQSADSTKTENVSLSPNQPVSFNQPLFFIDNNEVNESDVKKVNPEQITMINVIRDSTAISKYGERARNGVVVLHLRDNSKLSTHKKRSSNN